MRKLIRNGDESEVWILCPVGVAGTGDDRRVSDIDQQGCLGEDSCHQNSFTSK